MAPRLRRAANAKFNAPIFLAPSEYHCGSLCEDVEAILSSAELA